MSLADMGRHTYSHSGMAIARRDIVTDDSFAHCTWRCLNREFFLENDKIKDFILKTWLTYKDKYGVEIFDYCILANHVHLVVRIRSADALGAFMRVCNSLIARFINSLLHRDSHALKERYKSPAIEDEKYFLNTLAYVWLNYYKAVGIKPADYKYGSAFFRARGLKSKLLSSYRDTPIGYVASEQRFVIDAINAALSKDLMGQLADAVYEHSHTIAGASLVGARSLYLRSLRRKAPS